MTTRTVAPAEPRAGQPRALPRGLCPTAEQLAAYLDGRLTAADRDRLEEHLGGCASCCAVIAGAVRFESERAAADPSPTR